MSAVIPCKRGGHGHDHASNVDRGGSPPDLAIEVLSPSDSPRQVLDKVGEYLAAGVRLVWVIDPAERRATVYRALSEVRTVAESEHLDGEDVVPGFRCILGDLL
jgi:Uma2 family endonuclease